MQDGMYIKEEKEEDHGSDCIHAFMHESRCIPAIKGPKTSNHSTEKPSETMTVSEGVLRVQIVG